MHEAMEALGERIAEAAAHIDAAMHRLLVDIREFDEQRGWHPQGAQSCAHWLSWRVGWDLATARERVRVAHRLAQLPLIDAALEKAEISYSKARAMSRVGTTENERVLLDYARAMPAAQLETVCRKYQMIQRVASGDPDREAAERMVTRRTREDGLVTITAVLRPEEAALVWAALDRATTDASAETPNRADGLVALAKGYGSGEGASVEIVVTVPHASLTGDSAEPGMIGADPVSAEAVRRLACDCGIVLAVESADGEVLSVGRRTRTITTPIHRALRRRDDGCRFPGCVNRRFVDGHHVKHWAEGGETKLSNLVSLCDHHHKAVHEHRFTVELDAAQQPTFRDRRGRVVAAVPAPRPASWKALWLRNAPLAITPTTGLCHWNGDPLDHDAAVHGLLHSEAHA